MPNEFAVKVDLNNKNLRVFADEQEIGVDEVSISMFDFSSEGEKRDKEVFLSYTILGDNEERITISRSFKLNDGGQDVIVETYKTKSQEVFSQVKKSVVDVFKNLRLAASMKRED